jgi:hypothetical protein
MVRLITGEQECNNQSLTDYESNSKIKGSSAIGVDGRR